MEVNPGRRALTLANSSSMTSLSVIEATLRKRIQSGYYSPGERLPAERVLSEELGVHRRIVRAAIARLVSEQLISQRPNCCPVVQAPPAHHALPSQSRLSLPSSAAPGVSASRFVALIIWHGGPLEQGRTVQQRIFWGMNQELQRAGYHVVFLDLGETIGSEQENASREAAHLRYVMEQGFGGAVFYPYAYQSNRELIQEVSRSLPLCLIDRMLPGVEADFVGTENYQGMFEATTHLIRQGHRRIAYLTKSESINPVQDRLRGYQHALNAAFHTDRDEIVLTAPSFNGDDWFLFDTLFSLPKGQRPTAAIGFNDSEAERATRRLQKLNLRVPQDVALVGFDDIVRTLPNGVGLTSVAQPFEDMGRTAAKVFLRRLQNPASPRAHIELPNHLIIRESSPVFDDSD
jgi:GntR family transcriptional regulator of arabinose operon